ncbi:MAG TPA: CcmD family protein [Polyangiaceae bacterium]|nr:CcmD family protein [Polyangiaceae bacterium]
MSWAAQDTAPGQKTPEDRSTQFVPVQGGNESTSAEALLVTAYIVMWAALIVFVFLTWRKQGALEKRIERLDDTLKKSIGKT